MNQIVSERLQRERAKTEPTQDETREQELNAREAKMNCRDYLTEKKYDARLLDILDTSNADSFKEMVEKLREVFPAIEPESLPRFASGTGSARLMGKEPDPIASAFKLKR